MSDRLFDQLRLDRMQLLRQGFAAAEGARFRPPTDVYETDEAVIVIVEVAGLDEGQYEVTLSEVGQVLTVAGRRQALGLELGGATFHQLEIAYGHFAVEVPLSLPLQGPDAATAEYSNGFLVVRLLKAQPRHVPVRVISAAGDS